MSERLLALEEAEAEAAARVEKAEREAGSIRASIREEKETLRKEGLKRLHAERKKLEEHNNEAVLELRAELEKHRDVALESLRQKAPELSRKALELLIERLTAEEGKATRSPEESAV